MPHVHLSDETIQSYTIGHARIVMYAEHRRTIIVLNCGRMIEVSWDHEPAADHLVERLGPDFNRGHDPLHVLVAHMLGIGDSGPLRHGAGYRPVHPLWREEEEVVFALQRYMHKAGISLEQVLEAWRTH